MYSKLEKSWRFALNEYFETEEFKKLSNFIKNEYTSNIIYPVQKDLFSAFNKVSFYDVKVVIIGQDPYHGESQAHGLCFSVQNSVKVPPSLKNIYKEIENDLQIKKDFTKGNLESWTSQGVFLLNSVLSVRKSCAGSHTKKGWEDFTNYVVDKLSSNKKNLVFLLWGNYAKQKGKIIDRNKHLVLEASHPSPFSAYNGFFGCKHFSKTNAYLINNNKEGIDW